jgi:hypothetical protein
MLSVSVRVFKLYIDSEVEIDMDTVGGEFEK